ncbi:MAG: HAD family hydrolase [Anaerolineae bacterium]|nr:HAD family hydrolase [Anaerolineae bacterium]MDW8070708.1 HAD family hydrolase [Anaerolineae bacterium]
MSSYESWRDQRRGLVIFDLDGTLFCSDGATVPAVQQIFAAYGLPVPAEQEIVHYIGPLEDEFHRWIRSLCPSHLAEEVLAAVLQREHELLSRSARLYDGIDQVLTRLRPVVGALALCTYASPRYAREVLRSHAIADFFDMIRCREAPTDTKYQMISEVLHHLRHRPAVVVGDRAVDIEAAHAHGLVAVGVLYGYGSAEELARADAFVESPAQLLDTLIALLKRAGVNSSLE